MPAWLGVCAASTWLGQPTHPSLMSAAWRWACSLTFPWPTSWLHAAVVGLRLHARLYPTGAGLRDTAQLDLLRRLRARIGDRWSWQLEAPLNISGDLRAFDAVLTGAGTTIAIEAITRLRDAQAQLRAAALKQRDGQIARLVIVLLGTNHNRAALASAADVLATTFPLGTRATLAALSQGKDPGDDGIVLL